jgi:membrane peptidoglycan carboxypeptidase
MIMNTVYYGNHAYGVEAAARQFLEAREEPVAAQSALLAGSPGPGHDPSTIHRLLRPP